MDYTRAHCPEDRLRCEDLVCRYLVGELKDLKTAKAGSIFTATIEVVRFTS